MIHVVPDFLGKRKAAQAGADLSYSDTALPALGAKAPNLSSFQFEKQVIFSYVLRPVAGRKFLKRSCRKEITESSYSTAKWGNCKGYTACPFLEDGATGGLPSHHKWLQMKDAA